MKNEFKKNLQKGTIYLKDGVWVVRHQFLKNAIRYITIRKKDTKNLIDPYSQAKETCFEIITEGENLDQYAKLWPISEMAQELQYYFENTPQEQIDKDWEATKEFDNVGPTVEEFLGIDKTTQMKELFLLRGLPGSGKSTLANSSIRFDHHFEADTYFIDKNGEYKFDGTKLKEAHAYCQAAVEEAMSWDQNVEQVLRSDWRSIAVSNTFTQEWEMQPYYDLAEKYGYRVYSLIVENRHGGVNEHGVPEEKLVQMKNRFEVKL